MKYIILILLGVSLFLNIKHYRNSAPTEFKEAQTVENYSYVGSDGYIFYNKQWDLKRFKIDIITYSSFDKINKEAQAQGLPKTNDYAAFSWYDPKTNVCHINVLDPSKGYYPEYVGHELFHCMYGQWHIDNNTR